MYFGNGSATAVWSPTALGASGIMVLNLDLYNPSGIVSYVNGSIYLIQNVTFPSTPLSVTLNITYYSAYASSFTTLRSYYLFAELLYANRSVAWSGLQSVATGSWSNATFMIPTTSITPGETYTLIVGAGVSGYVYNTLGLQGSINSTLYLDCVHLYVEIEENNGDVLRGSAVKKDSPHSWYGCQWRLQFHYTTL